MVRFAIEFDQFGADDRTTFSEDGAHRFDMRAFKHRFPILRSKDQVRVKQKDAMATRAVFGSRFRHKTPNVNFMA